MACWKHYVLDLDLSVHLWVHASVCVSRRRHFSTSCPSTLSFFLKSNHITSGRIYWINGDMVEHLIWSVVTLILFLANQSVRIICLHEMHIPVASFSGFTENICGYSPLSASIWELSWKSAVNPFEDHYVYDYKCHWYCCVVSVSNCACSRFAVSCPRQFVNLCKRLTLTTV